MDGSKPPSLDLQNFDTHLILFLVIIDIHVIVIYSVYINNVSSSGTLEEVLFTFYQYNWLFYDPCI
jgi:hypothetical protein